MTGQAKDQWSLRYLAVSGIHNFKALFICLVTIISMLYLFTELLSTIFDDLLSYEQRDMRVYASKVRKVGTLSF